jgi:hypothetical protein
VYNAVSLLTVTKELSKYKLALVEIEKVKWGKGGTHQGEREENQLRVSGVVLS